MITPAVDLLFELIMEQDFKNWTQSDAFKQGHKRAFADMEQAKLEGKPEPMQSQFVMYDLLTD